MKTMFYLIKDEFGTIVDAGQFNPAFSWDGPRLEALMPGDTITVQSRQRLSEDERKELDTEERKRRIDRLKDQLARVIEDDAPTPKLRAVEPDTAF